MSNLLVVGHKDLGHYYYLHWVIGRIKRIPHAEDNEAMLIKLYSYESELKELKKKLKAEGR